MIKVYKFGYYLLCILVILDFINLFELPYTVNIAWFFMFSTLAIIEAIEQKGRNTR